MIKLHCHIAKVDEIRENFKHSIPVTDRHRPGFHSFHNFVTLQSQTKLNLQNNNKWKVCSGETENIQSY